MRAQTPRNAATIATYRAACLVVESKIILPQALGTAKTSVWKSYSVLLGLADEVIE
jgi:hypothetical protein